MIVFPNAKINIGLNIKYKRADGFHELESIMYPIPLNDVLEIIPAQKNEVYLSGQVLKKIRKEDNLVFKAWQLMNNHYNIAPVEIYLHKNIPSGAGLGGGSSDAAFTLKALNTIFDLNLPVEKLEKHASALGSDCAFFISNQPALATGRGEKIKPVCLNLKGKHLIIVTPDIHISTAEAYAGLSIQQNNKSLEAEIQKPFERWQKNITNDFELHIFDQYPRLKKVCEALHKSGARYTAMSGSGSAIYGIFNNKVQQINIDEKYFTLAL